MSGISFAAHNEGVFELEPTEQSRAVAQPSALHVGTVGREREPAATRERLDVTEPTTPERRTVGLLQPHDIGPLAFEHRRDPRQRAIAMARALQQLVAAVGTAVGNVEREDAQGAGGPLGAPRRVG